MAYSLQVKGYILEKYLRDYLAAYECYTKWADIGTNLIGHDFKRLRSWLRASKLKPNKQLMELMSANLDKGLWPSKEERFWSATAFAVIYTSEGTVEDVKRAAKKALEIIGESEPTVLQRLLGNHRPIPDSLDITYEEISIVRTLAFKGKR
jgi:hypothetical protein